MKRFHNDKYKFKNIKKNKQKIDKEDINVFIINLYFYIIAIMYIYLKE